MQNTKPNIVSYPSCPCTAESLAVKPLLAQISVGPHGCSGRESPIPPQPPFLPWAVFLSAHCSSTLFLCRLTGNEPLTILPLTSEMEEAAIKAHYKVCDRLKLEKKQRRMCRRDPGVAETLMEAISMSALECQYQFRFERWNCTLEGRYRASLLKRGERSGSLGWVCCHPLHPSASLVFCRVVILVHPLPTPWRSRKSLWKVPGSAHP